MDAVVVIRVRRALAVGVSLVVLTVGAAGCFAKKSPAKRRYLISSASPSAGRADRTTEQRPSVKLARVRVAPLFDSKGFVYRIGKREYETDFYHEFYASPGVVLEDAIHDWLRVNPAFGAVRSARDPESTAWLLTVWVDELYGDAINRDRPRAVLALTVELRDGRSNNAAPPLLSRSYVVATPMASTDAESLIDGWGASLDRILQDLGEDLRSALASAAAG